MKKNPAALDRLKSIRGSLAFKHLTVSGPVAPRTFRQLSVSGEMEKLRLHARILPGPLRVDKGNFSWRQNRLVLKKIDALLGNSSISNFSADFDLGKSPFFKIHSPAVKLFADEVYPWLMSFENIESFLKDFSVAKGTVFLPDLNLNGPMRFPGRWHYDLTCKMKNLVIASDAFGEPITIHNGSFGLTSESKPKTVRHRVRLNAADLIWGKNHLALTGGMILSHNETLLDLTLTADAVDWDQAKNIFDYVENKSKDPSSRISKRVLLGTLKVQADTFNYDTYAVSPLKADLLFKPNNVIIAVNEAAVCNISFRGELKFYGQTLEIFLIPVAVDQELAPAVSCFSDQQHLATGNFNLNGQLLSKGKPNEILQPLSGEMAFSAEKGRIYRLGLLAKILSILNVTEIYRGEIPDLTGEGFAYHGMTISANLQGGKLIMQECSIDGASMGIACEGHIDLSEKEMDLVILVAPFKTLDRIVKFLPLIKHILGGKLISIPFRAKGELADPEVTPLHPTAVGSGVLGVLERTLKLPITIMQPVFSPTKNIKNNDNANDNPGPSGRP